MGDTLDFLANNPEAVSVDDTGIDIDALRDHLPEMTASELRHVCDELEICNDFATEEVMREKINDFISANDGTANVIDITHASESLAMPKNEDVSAVPSTTLVGPNVNDNPAIVSSDEIDSRIVTIKSRYWVNPFTGNNVPHGQRDTDGRGNVDGFSVPVPAPKPSDPPAIYDGE